MGPTRVTGKDEEPVRTGDQYLAWIPRRIAAQIGGQERQVEAALASGDAAALERIADAANVISIEGRTLRPDEVEVARAPTAAELLADPAGSEARRRAIEDLLEGRIAAQLFFAGAATRFKKAGQGLL